MTQGALAFTSEIQRRQGWAHRLATALRSRPGEWVGIQFMSTYGSNAWRSRLPTVRRTFQKDAIGIVEWNEQNGPASRYRFIPERWLQGHPPSDLSSPGG